MNMMISYQELVRTFLNNFGTELLVTVSNNPRRMTSPDYFLTKHLLKLTFQ